MGEEFQIERLVPKRGSQNQSGATIPSFMGWSSNKADTEVSGVNPGGPAAFFLYRIPDTHFLSDAGGQYRAKALVEITFPNAPDGTTSAEIVVAKTPADLGP